ncbi:transposase [Fructilactobacillus sanfranciscensis]|nr:transposase [Fructilactobacillus sanfranciscensis]
MNPLNWRTQFRRFFLFTSEIKLAAIKDYNSGIPTNTILRKYGIKGTATLYEWIKRLEIFGESGLINNSTKTRYSYSFKIKVINWRLENNESYPNTSRYFKIRNPVTIFQWEKLLSSGRLKPFKGRLIEMNNNKESLEEKLNRLEQENTYLKAKIQYMGKIKALAQRQKKCQTEKKHK